MVKKGNTERTNVTMKNDLLYRIDEFKDSPIGKKLMIHSRADFCERLATVFFLRLDTQYDKVEELFKITPEDLKGIGHDLET